MGEYDFRKPTEVDVVSGSCMMVRTAILKASGLLDENTFLYAEEFIVHEKLRRLNMSTYIVPLSKIIHKGGQSTKAEPSFFASQQNSESLRYYLDTYRNYPTWFIHVLLLNQRLVYGILKLRYSFRKERNVDG